MKSGKMRVLVCFAAGVMAVLGAGACKYSPKKVKAAELTANFSFAKARGRNRNQTKRERRAERVRRGAS